MTSSATEPFYKQFYPDAYRRFEIEITDHQMTVLHDDGLCRHLRFKRPDQSFYWFDIITWPGSLVIKGDMGTYVFTRLEDMFEFFGTGDMNPGYWAEKTPNYGRDESIRRHDEEKAEAIVREVATSYLEHHPVDDEADFWQRIEDDVLMFVMSPGDLIHAAMQFECDGHDVFSDFWEHDFTEYTAQFLWSCLAIPYAIRTYRTTNKEN